MSQRSDRRGITGHVLLIAVIGSIPLGDFLQAAAHAHYRRKRKLHVRYPVRG